MPLSESWAPFFPIDARRRGKSHVEQEQVQLQPADDRGSFHATVAESSDVAHEVYLESQARGTLVTCGCVDEGDDPRCPHVWATLLALDASPQHREAAESSLLPRPARARKRQAGHRSRATSEPPWSNRLSLLRPSTSVRTGLDALLPVVRRQIVYQIDAALSHRQDALVIDVAQRWPTGSGRERTRPCRLDPATIGTLGDAADVEIAAFMIGAGLPPDDGLGPVPVGDRPRNRFVLRSGSQRALLQRMVDTGRCFLIGLEGGQEPPPLQMDPAGTWAVWAVGTRGDVGLRLEMELRRADHRLPIETPPLVLGGPAGLVVHENRVAWLDDGGASRWVAQFRDAALRHGAADPIEVPWHQKDLFVERLFLIPHLPRLDLPEEVQRPQRRLAPTLHLKLVSAEEDPGTSLTAHASFGYDEQRIKPNHGGRFLYCDGDLLVRDEEAERRALATLAACGFAANAADDGQSLTLKQRHVSDALARLAEEGWDVTMDSQTMRQPGQASFSITSDIDWFELHGGIRYSTASGEQLVTLPEILAAANEGRYGVALADGSMGLLPQAWLAGHGLMAALGERRDDHLRFRSGQALLIDALLDTSELQNVDAQFEAVRQRAKQFDGIKPLEESQRFVGTLRSYQRDGLGWLNFLRDIGMGGILADDMGLGKTIQVLSMLDLRRAGGEVSRPSLIVVPRSVMYNWMDEARRFTPDLRMAAYSGTQRHILRDHFQDYDVVVTTYGLMRRDIADLHGLRFDYAVLDEAQSVKNPQSQLAKAARLLQADHRLALTGTPVENHLGDLWSIFEYLNPGLLGTSTRFARLVRGERAGEGGNGSPRDLGVAQQAGAAVRPFVLRRTKREVLKELPEKTDQTLLCVMKRGQRRIYDELLQHYRESILSQVPGSGSRGLGSSTFVVLEALLRLRQAACHPGLIDPKRRDEPSAKLEALVENLEQLIDEGHKSLVFSQFTTMLSIVGSRLDEVGIPYAYLDGQTRQREKQVERFQTDKGCPVFLISLKAGGLGLNLTAANYVFILDPWWNPAVELQAIDRAHRIGQTQRVFAYRMICADTVEQRISELQEHKKRIADAIVDGQENILRSLTRQDLEQLLS